MAKSVEGKYFFYRTFGRVIFYKILGVTYGGFYVAHIDVALESGGRNKIGRGGIVDGSIYTASHLYGELHDWARIRDAELVTGEERIHELDAAFSKCKNQEYYQCEGAVEYEPMLFSN